MTTSARLARSVAFLLPIVISLLAVQFSAHALARGANLFGAGEPGARLFHGAKDLGTWMIYGHMMGGALITTLAPVQLIPQVRRCVPQLHHALGYLVAGLSLLTAVAGLIYIQLHGTVGGPLMSLAFGVYGGLMVIAAWRCLSTARTRSPAHPWWGARLIVLVMGSWIYRVMYGLWYATTGGAMSDAVQFSGVFDQIMVFAFYLPWLVILECVLRRWGPRPR